MKRKFNTPYYTLFFVLIALNIDAQKSDSKIGWYIKTEHYLNGENTTPIWDFILCGNTNGSLSENQLYISRYFSRKNQKWAYRYPFCSNFSDRSYKGNSIFVEQIPYQLRSSRIKYYNALLDEDYAKIDRYFYFNNEYPERYDKFYFRHAPSIRAIHPYQGYRIYSTKGVSLKKELCPIIKSCMECDAEQYINKTFTPKLEDAEFKTEKGILTYRITDLGYARLDSTTNVGLFELYNEYTKDLKFKITTFDDKNIIKDYKLFSLKNEITNIDTKDYNLIYFNRMSKNKLIFVLSTTSYQSFTSKEKTFFIGKDKQVHYDWIDISETAQKTNNFLVVYNLETANYIVKAFYPSGNNNTPEFYSYSHGLIVNFGGDLGIINYDLNGVATWRNTGSLTDYALIGNSLYALGYTKDEGYIGYNNTTVYKIDIQTGNILNKCIIDYKNLTPNRIFVYDDNLLIVGDKMSIYDNPKKFEGKTYEISSNSKWYISADTIEESNRESDNKYENTIKNEPKEINSTKDVSEDLVNKIFDYNEIDKAAEFPGGQSELYKYISKNLKYPVKEREASIQGSVFVKFVIQQDGTISNPEIIKGVIGGEGLSNEAIRVVKELPNWKPAEKNNKAVNSYYTIPIKFRVQ